MKIQVRFLGPIRRPGRAQQQKLELPASTTVGGMLAALSYDPKERAWITALIDGKRVRPDTALRDGQTVDLTIVAGGG